MTTIRKRELLLTTVVFQFFQRPNEWHCFPMYGGESSDLAFANTSFSSPLVVVWSHLSPSRSTLTLNCADGVMDCYFLGSAPVCFPFCLDNTSEQMIPWPCSRLSWVGEVEETHVDAVSNRNIKTKVSWSIINVFNRSNNLFLLLCYPNVSRATGWLGASWPLNSLSNLTLALKIKVIGLKNRVMLMALWTLI